MSYHILCLFLKRISPKVFGISGSNLHKLLELLCSFNIYLKNFILSASSDNDKPMLMRQKNCKQGFAYRSLINRRNKIGPRTVPRGTPDRTVDQLDDEPFTTTRCLLLASEKNPISQKCHKIWPLGGAFRKAQRRRPSRN